jgi:hypothetical protein
MDEQQAGQHRGRGPKGYTRSDDLSITHILG